MLRGVSGHQVACESSRLSNPLAIIVEAFTWGLFGVGEFYPRALGITALAMALLLMAGLMYFVRTEARTIADR